MAKLIAKGATKDRSRIQLKFLCSNGKDTYIEEFKVTNFIHQGYGCCERTPDFEIKVFGVIYECFWRSLTTGIDNLCRIKEVR